jgi:hydrogenase expression/formation protein HypE
MKPDKILLDHGSGGKISHRLTADLLLPAFDNPALAMLDDGAALKWPVGASLFPRIPTWWTPFFSPAAASVTWPSTAP